MNSIVVKIKVEFLSTFVHLEEFDYYNIVHSYVVIYKGNSC